MKTVSAKTVEKLATNLMQTPARVLELGDKIGSATLKENPKAAPCTSPDVVNFFHTGKDLYLEKIVSTHT